MRAKINDLEGKYYGTVISVTLDDGTEGEINVWIHGKTCNPSERECEACGITKEQWEKNAVLRKVESDDEWITTKSIGEDFTAVDQLNICDSHYESAETYEICRRIVAALNAPKRIGP